jgi:hypothetical protein
MPPFRELPGAVVARPRGIHREQGAKEEKEEGPGTGAQRGRAESGESW